MKALTSPKQVVDKIHEEEVVVILDKIEEKFNEVNDIRDEDINKYIHLIIEGKYSLISINIVCRKYVNIGWTNVTISNCENNEQGKGLLSIKLYFR